MRLRGKHILLGVTGSIAAYKAAVLARLLVKEGAQVKVVMTSTAKQFITPLTLATLTKNPILIDFFNPENGQWNSHVSLGVWADLYLIAPATANTIAKMAYGVADNLLLTTYLSSRCHVMVAPAMDVDMCNHPATMSNMDILRSRGVEVIEPESGELASGLNGKGRMEEPEHILDAVVSFFNVPQNDFLGKKVLITAGPTHEPIDPVRFIGNHSSGKMGYAIAEELAQRGADVVLISGPVSVDCNLSNVKVVKINSALEMYQECLNHFRDVDIAIMAAAVADFTPEIVSDIKIKREADEDGINLHLKPTKDIAASLGKIKLSSQILVGFALETNDEINHAKDKLLRKNLDFIVLNSLNDDGAGFGYDTNQITIIDNRGEICKFGLKSKIEVAKDIANKLVTYL